MPEANISNKIERPYLAYPENQFLGRLETLALSFVLEGLEGVSHKHLKFEIAAQNLPLRIGQKHPGDANLYFWNSYKISFIEASHIEDIRGVSREHAYFKAVDNHLF